MKPKSSSQTVCFNLRVLIRLSIVLASFVLAFTATAQEAWVARYKGPGNSNDVAYAVAVDTSGNVYVTGFSVGSGTGTDYATIKYNASGAQQWVARYNGPGNDNDYATIKYNPSGQQQRIARYNNGLVNGDDSAQSIAVDASGNVYVTGLARAWVTSVFPPPVPIMPRSSTTLQGNSNGSPATTDRAMAMMLPVPLMAQATFM
jgi:hypothetical protein